MRQLKYIWRTYREIIVASFMCLVGFGTLVFGVLPTVKNTLASFDEIKTLSADVQTLSQKAATLDALPETTLRAQLAIIVSAIPTDKAIPSVFATVDRVAAAAGVQVVDMSVTQAGSLATSSAQKLSAEEKTLGASLLPLALSLRGSTEGLRAFISRIGSVRRLLRIRNFDISVIAPGNVQARLALDTFYVPLPTTIGKIEQPLTKLTKEQEDALTKLASFPWFSQPQVSAPQGAVFGHKENPFAR
ncbi:type 4a pilus biogenesis protein PilO [Candidatus Gottesmanbacteria bacterium]|nr:type 4a pilus biogenesis protein PilO [Candidatus Gottesmanbacteria bacterium]